MAIDFTSAQRQRDLTGIGVSLALHALLLAAWQVTRPSAPPEDDGPRRALFLRLLPTSPAPAVPAPAVPAQAESQAQPTAARPSTAQPAAARPSTSVLAVGDDRVPDQAADTVAEAEATQAPDAAPLSAADLLSRAKAAAAGADRAVRRENPRRGIEAPIETAQMKLEKGMTRASDMAPNKWYEAPKVQEIRDPGGYDRRRYRIVGPNGTYCMTYESNHAPDGIDTMSRGMQQKRTNCPPHEQPLTFQKWNETPPSRPRAPLAPLRD